jgi:hypothetical protein
MEGSATCNNSELKELQELEHTLRRACTTAQKPRKADPPKQKAKRFQIGFFFERVDNKL